MPTLRMIFFALVFCFMPIDGHTATPDVASITKQAEEGDAKAQFSLGMMYIYGNGVLQDYTQALALFR